MRDSAYAIEREYEDVAAVVNAIGGPVDGFGHSFGADVLLGAMPLTDNLRRAVIYESNAGAVPTPAWRTTAIRCSHVTNATQSSCRSTPGCSPARRPRTLTATAPRPTSRPRLRSPTRSRASGTPANSGGSCRTPYRSLKHTHVAAARQRIGMGAPRHVRGQRRPAEQPHHRSQRRRHMAIGADPELVARLLVEFLLSSDTTP